jgi:Cu-Zn family superoxide dismutase
MLIKYLISTLLLPYIFTKQARCYMIPDNESGLSGFVTFTQDNQNNPVNIDLNVYGTTKIHGFHIHEKGTIIGGCISAGSHFNPLNRHHGAPNATDRHLGDLGNIISTDGSVRYTFTDHQMSLFNENKIIGRTCVIHERNDDLGLGGNPESLKTGNSGGRIACGVVEEIGMSVSVYFITGVIAVMLLGGSYFAYFRRKDGYEPL